MIGETDFIARIKYFTTEEGGRKTPAKSGYFPQVKFAGKEGQIGGEQIFIGVEWVKPGETIEAGIKILVKEYFAKYLYAGQKFEIKEANHLVGEGTILKILNKDLEK